MKWSFDGQTPAYLALTRMATLAPEVIEGILTKLTFEPGMRVLDVGCGSGEYVFRLGNVVEGVSFIGLDYDQAFVDIANKRASGEADALYEPVNDKNTYEFVQGDGLSLPFENESFDAVISHTYLTAIGDYQGALLEMIRVCKPGGQVSSITNMNTNFHGMGSFKLFPPVVDPAIAPIVGKVETLKHRVRYIDMSSGVPTHKVQRLFAHLCLEDVGAKPLGQYFCLSDTQTSPEQYERYVELLYRVECENAERMRGMSESKDMMTDEEWDQYLTCAEMRKDMLLAVNGYNQEWTWYGGSALLVWGKVPEDGLAPFCEMLAEEREGVERCRERAHDRGLEVRERIVQAGPGRVCRVQLELETPHAKEGVDAKKKNKGKGKKSKGKASKKKAASAKKQSPIEKTILNASGFNPSLAYEEAYAILLGDDKKARKQYDKAERKVEKALAKGQMELAPVESEGLYSIDLMWDTVAEAIELGWNVVFRDAEPATNVPTIVCDVIAGSYHYQGVAAHSDRDVAITRAVSRALAKIAPDFL